MVLIINFVAKEYKHSFHCEFTLSSVVEAAVNTICLFSFVSLSKSLCIHFGISVSQGFIFYEDHKIAKFQVWGIAKISSRIMKKKGNGFIREFNTQVKIYNICGIEMVNCFAEFDFFKFNLPTLT